MLNARQKAFCEYYVTSGNATESARRAGYSENYATNRIHELMKNVGICGYIEELNNKIKSERIADMTEVKEFWTKTLRNDKVKMQDRLKASEYLAKTNGAFLEKLEVKGSIPVVISGEDQLEE